MITINRNQKYHIRSNKHVKSVEVESLRAWQCAQIKNRLLKSVKRDIKKAFSCLKIMKEEEGQ